MKIKKLIWMFSAAYLLTACTGSNKSEEIIDTAEDVDEKTQEVNAFALLESTCFSCHSPNALGDSSAGPTFQTIKKHYAERYGEKTLFVNALSDFVLNPSQDNASMSIQVEKYGVMPNMGLSEEQAKAIATYLFDQDIENDNWYATKFNLEKAKYAVNPEDMSYKERGFQFAMATKSVLGKNLKGKVKDLGTDGALDFCNIKAIHLTDSMAAELGVTIKRVSDKNRNPKNAANDEELAIMEDFKNQLAEKGTVEGTTKEFDEYVNGYYPILTNQMCLQCHGTIKEVKPSTAMILQEKYPNDKATGYRVDQLRGIWVVKMAKN